MDPRHFRRLVNQVLQLLDPYSPGGSGVYTPEAVELLMGTAAQESRFRWFYQLLGGPGIGFLQLEPATVIDLWNSYLRYNPSLIDGIVHVCGVSTHTDWQLQVNLAYQITMARIRYLPAKPALPAADDLEGMAHYWNDFYNRNPYKGTPEEFMKNYHDLVA